MHEKLRVVLVGGAGFLGRHVAAELMARFGPSGVEMLIVGRKHPPQELPGSYIKGDRNDPAVIDELMRWRPDFWFDLALYNAPAMEALVASWRHHPGVKLFTFSGSIAEYGLERKLPLPVKEDQPLLGTGSYARGKIEAWETGIRAFRKDGFPLVWGVLPQLWGPFDPHGRDCEYATRLAQGLPIMLRGNGRTLMPDGFVETVAFALTHVGLNPANAGLRFNIAGAQVLTPLMFLRWCAGALRRKLTIVHVPPEVLPAAEAKVGRRFRPVFGDYDLTLDLTRLRSTGLTLPCSAKEGVVKTVLWHVANASRSNPAFSAWPEDLLSLCNVRLETEY